MELLPVDSASVSQTFHNKGINMRYLGQVCALSTIPHVKSLCIVEMCARSIKKIFRTTLTDYILTNFQKDNPAIYAQIRHMQLNDKQSQQNNSYTSNLSNVQVTDHKEGLRQTIKNKMDADIKVNTLDFLNFVFGGSEQSLHFWHQILRNQVMVDFGYDILQGNEEAAAELELQLRKKKQRQAQISKSVSLQKSASLNVPPGNNNGNVAISGNANNSGGV